uniref:Uncharacterized protein TCIL3000_8_650 n=1 Tax=Trypanosoma congolense (strain IL3000) TaxID=1068625 RepID=G0UR47_TRYCI|nr:unnamed protein product [Trypanosoma congolense IL3000]
MAAVYLRNASSCQRKASIDDATPGSLGFHHGSLKVGRTGADSVISRCSSRAKRSAADREKKVVASAGCAAWLGVGKKHGPCPRATTEPSSKLSSTARDTSGCGTSGGDGVVRKRRSYCRGQQPIYHLCAPTFQDSMCCDDPKTLCPLSDHLWSSSAVKTLPPFFHEKSVKGPRGVLNENKHHRCTTCCCSPVPKVGDCRYAASIGRCCHSSDLYSLNISTCSRDDYKIKPCCCCRSTSYRPRATSPDASSCSVGVCSQAPCHDASLQGELFLLNNTGRFTVQKEQKGGSVWQRLVSESEWHKSPERHPATCNSVADGADSTVNSDLKCKPRCTEKSDLLERIRKCLSELGEHRITQ